LLTCVVVARRKEHARTSVDIGGRDRNTACTIYAGRDCRCPV
jgi:hypothetical protein